MVKLADGTKGSREKVVAIFKRDLTLTLFNALPMYYFTLIWIFQCVSVKKSLTKHSRRRNYTGVLGVNDSRGGLHLKDDIRMH